MYTREASSLDLFTDSVRLMGDATLCVVMEFEKRLDPARLGDAAQACLRAHPILHSRLVRGSGPAQWEMDENVCVTPIGVVESPEEYHPLVIGPVNPYLPLQFRVRILRRPSGDAVVINLAHAAADGFGLYALSSQLLQEYQNPGSILPAEGGIPERDTLWTRRLFSGEIAADGGMEVINPMWPDPFGRSRAPSSFHRVSLSPEILDAIRGRSKALGGSINDAAMAAYYLAMTDITGHRAPIALFLPVNLRQHLNDGSRQMSNQAVNVSFVMERRPGEGMEEILPRVIAGTKALKARGIGIEEQVRMDAISDPEGRRIHEMVEEMAALERKGLADIFFSNPGPITLPDIDGLADAYLTYPGGYMPTTCIITSTFRGKMTVTMGYQDSGRAREGTRKAVQLFHRYLASFAGRP